MVIVTGVVAVVFLIAAGAILLFAQPLDPVLGALFGSLLGNGLWCAILTVIQVRQRRAVTPPR
jgi:hypothetical protein